DPDNVTTATFSFLVNRPVDVVAWAVDPQHWDDCCTAYFPECWIVLQGGQPDPSPPPPPADWDNPLFEHFETQLLSGVTRYTNNLQVIYSSNLSLLYDPDYDPADPLGRHVRLDYCLRDSLDSIVGGDLSQPGGLVVDEGYALAQDVGSGWTAVTAR